MVKQLDDEPLPPLIDHVGWRLWRLSRRWKLEYEAEMVARGCGFLTEARGAVIGHLRPAGASQAAIAVALGISKQAVQQLVDELVAEGVVARVPNPDDARGKLVRLTTRGAEALAVSNAVKQEIEARYRAILGDAPFGMLMWALEVLGGDRSGL